MILGTSFSQSSLVAQASNRPVDLRLLLATFVALAISLGVAFLLGRTDKGE